MSYTIDANVLLYASDESSPVHARARAFVQRLADGPEIAYLFWPTVMAYLRIATHPAVFARPMTAAEAIGNVEQLLARPHVRTTGEQERFWGRYREVSDDAVPAGNLVPDRTWSR
jgi:toxin-antitoxin system PIN domain toxin